MSSGRETAIQLSTQQIDTLETDFQRNKNPTFSDVEFLAALVGVSIEVAEVCITESVLINKSSYYLMISNKPKY